MHDAELVEDGELVRAAPAPRPLVDEHTVLRPGASIPTSDDPGTTYTERDLYVSEETARILDESDPGDSGPMKAFNAWCAEQGRVAVPCTTATLDVETLTEVLEKVRQWTPFDGGTLLDDVAAALDDVPPTEEDTEELAERLRGHLMRLVTIAVAAEAEEDTAAAQLIERARALRVEDLPGGRWKAVAHLRRLGWTANELHDRLAVIRCLKEAA